MPRKAATTQNAQLPLERQLWQAADRLRLNVDAAKYKDVVLGLVFLKHISDTFTVLYQKLSKNKRANPEERDEYTGEGCFYVPPKARWSYLQENARKPVIGKLLNEAMDLIEGENSLLKSVLPKVYMQDNLGPDTLGGLIDIISNANLGKADVLGRVFEYFLGNFALAEGKNGGQFYTPRSVVELLVTMLEPYKGRIFDPCCGSGGMFVQSEKFIRAHRGKIDDIPIYGQESNRDTWRLAKMNLAIRHIDSSQVKWNSAGSFLDDEHRDLKADYIIANPPFNTSDWGGEKLRDDMRWQYGVPRVGEANYAWIQHFIHHLAPTGQAGFVMAKGALTSTAGGDGDIRKNLINAGLIDCIVNLPAKLFHNTQIPASLWFVCRSRDNGKYRRRSGEILFIDARDMGHLINRRNRELSDEDIHRIADTYHRWRNRGGKKYKDEAGFCCAASLERVREQDYALTPGRYVGLAEEEDNFDFTERLTALRTEFEQQIKEEVTLNRRIRKNLDKIKP